ncbi:MAG: carbohydrate ABC transporter permease [Oscillospiraceae bacterium]|nr:carbohydrate ABC transporter permease [Oscillospiraceae bacterium]
MTDYRRLSLPARIIIHAIMLSFAVMCIIPLWGIIAISLSNETDISLFGYSIFPRTPDLLGYRYVLTNPVMILNSYRVSIGLTLVGTAMSLIITAGLSYALSRADYKLRNHVSFFIFFTLLFSGGLVPWYMLISRYLNLKSTFWVLVLPYLVHPWFVLILRTFMQKIPMEIIESCMIDGSGEYRTFLMIVLPLSKPGLATVGLFTMLRYWNDWWLAMLFIEKDSLAPLQYMLYRMMNNIAFLTSSSNQMPPGLRADIQLPKESARMAMAVLAAGPMLMVFPFFQRYFVKGLTVGAVKG